MFILYGLAGKLAFIFYLDFNLPSVKSLSNSCFTLTVTHIDTREIKAVLISGTS